MAKPASNTQEAQKSRAAWQVRVRSTRGLRSDAGRVTDAALVLSWQRQLDRRGPRVLVAHDVAVEGRGARVRRSVQRWPSRPGRPAEVRDQTPVLAHRRAPRSDPPARPVHRRRVRTARPRAAQGVRRYQGVLERQAASAADRSERRPGGGAAQPGPRFMGDAGTDHAAVFGTALTKPARWRTLTTAGADSRNPEFTRSWVPAVSGSRL